MVLLELDMVDGTKAKKELRLGHLDAKGSLDDFKGFYEGYGVYSQIDLNNPEATGYVSQMLFGKDKPNRFSGMESEKFAQMYNALQDKAETKLEAYVGENMVQMVGKNGERDLGSLVLNLTTEVDNGDVLGFQKLRKKLETQEGAREVLTGDLDGVAENYREIIAGYGGDVILRSIQGEMQSKALRPYLNEDNKIDKEKVANYFGKNMAHYEKRLEALEKEVKKVRQGTDLDDNAKKKRLEELGEEIRRIGGMQRQMALSVSEMTYHALIRESEEDKKAEEDKKKK